MDRRGGGHGAEHIEESGVRGDLEVEIHEAVDEDSYATEERADGHGAGHGFGPVLEFAHGFAEDEKQIPDGDGEPNEAGFHQ